MRSHSLTSIDAAIARWALLKHPFYQAWTSGTLSRAALKRYARDYYPFVARFPRLVSALHSRVDDLGTRQLLLENLIDEERGDSPHPELWLRFAEGVGVERADLEESPDAMAPSAQRLVGDYERLAREAPVAAALAALYAYESQIPEVSTAKIDGLKAHLGITDDRTLGFFAVHEKADVEHAQALRGILARALQGEPALEATMVESGEEAARAHWRFLDGVVADARAAGEWTAAAA